MSADLDRAILEVEDLVIKAREAVDRGDRLGWPGPGRLRGSHQRAAEAHVRLDTLNEAARLLYQVRYQERSR